MREYEDRGVEWRRIAPPALPFVVLPRAAQRAELVASHDLGTHASGHVAGEVVVEPSASAGVRSVHPAGRGEGPREQVRGIGVSEWVLETLALAGAESV